MNAPAYIGVPAGKAPVRPRIGFVGVGAQGSQRLADFVSANVGRVAGIVDPASSAVRVAKAVASDAPVCATLEDLLMQDVDGVVIASPSALHADQALRALSKGAAVFCQRPLGRSTAETRRIVQAAKTADRLLGVDLPYRFIAGVAEMRSLLTSGALGEVFSASLLHHSARAPEAPWSSDVTKAGGGCLVDSGTFLIDLALWLLGQKNVVGVEGRAFRNGKRLVDTRGTTEDYVTARLLLGTGAEVSIACSWRLSVGHDALIEAVFYGTKGAVRLANVKGSPVDFVVERMVGKERQVLAKPPDPWRGRSLVAWAQRLAAQRTYDPSVESIIEVARVMDAVYAR